MAKTRYAACMACRSDAQKVAGITERQQSGLALGREKGTNHRTGYLHREESKRKVAVANKAFWAANPDKAIERGAKTRGSNHYKWKAGASKLNLSIRQMNENRKWMDAVKARDVKCVRCGDDKDLEAHHKTELAALVERLGIKSRDDARNHPLLWELQNGETLCRLCHYAEHGRRGEPSVSPRKITPRLCLGCGTTFVRKPSLMRGNWGKCCSRKCADALRSRKYSGTANPNWRGGRVEKQCQRCDGQILLKPAAAKRGEGKFCSWECRYADR